MNEWMTSLPRVIGTTEKEHICCPGGWEESEEGECLNAAAGVEGLPWAQRRWASLSGGWGSACRSTELGERL